MVQFVGYVAMLDGKATRFLARTKREERLERSGGYLCSYPAKFLRFDLHIVGKVDSIGVVLAPE